MNHLISQAHLQGAIACDSAGILDYHEGKPPDPRMVEAAANRGLTLHGRARQFQPRDFEKFDLILAMDRENYWDILALDPQNRYSDKVRLTCDFCTRYRLKEVPDPYYGEDDGFDRVLDLLFDACDGALRHAIAQLELHRGRETP